MDSVGEQGEQVMMNMEKGNHTTKILTNSSILLLKPDQKALGLALMFNFRCINTNSIKEF